MSTSIAAPIAWPRKLARSIVSWHLHGSAGLGPLASNPTPAGRIVSWSETEFVQAMREGVRPDGSVMHELMPWRTPGRMSDDELRAIWFYQATVPARPFGHK